MSRNVTHCCRIHYIPCSRQMPNVTCVTYADSVNCIPLRRPASPLQIKGNFISVKREVQTLICMEERPLYFSYSICEMKLQERLIYFKIYICVLRLTMAYFQSLLCPSSKKSLTVVTIYQKL